MKAKQTGNINDYINLIDFIINNEKKYCDIIKYCPTFQDFLNIQKEICENFFDEMTNYEFGRFEELLKFSYTILKIEYESKK